MIVLNQIEDGLWQAGRRHWPPSLPDVDVWLSLTPTALPVNFSGRTVSFPFPDSAEGMEPEKFEKLRDICEDLSVERVLTICEEGKNRSGLASALILIARGLEVEDAIAKVKANGSTPGSVEALSNPGFLRQLREDLP